MSVNKLLVKKTDNFTFNKFNSVYFKLNNFAFNNLNLHILNDIIRS